MYTHSKLVIATYQVFSYQGGAVYEVAFLNLFPIRSTGNGVCCSEFGVRRENLASSQSVSERLRL